MKLYIAGKVSKDSQFGSSNWRDGFVDQLADLSRLELTHLDPLVYEKDGNYDPQRVFDKDCALIAQADCVVVYLSDDISVGGSQEMLIAKYLQKPLIGLAPFGGKFNCAEKEVAGKLVQNFVDPFVYATCDVLCSTVEEVAHALQNLPIPKTIDLIDEAVERFHRSRGCPDD